MLLSTIFNTLTFGELSQHQLGGKKLGAIDIEDYPEVLSHLQLAITALCIRFPLLNKEVTFTELADVLDYTLVTPLNDLLRVTSISDEEGDERPLNDETNTDSLFLISPDTVQLPITVPGNINYVKYRANLPVITIINNDPTQTVIDLPDILLEPLCAWTGSRILSFSNNGEQKNTSTFYYGRYEHRCAELERNNTLYTSSRNSNIKPELRRYP